jgi:capsular polysaccharide biosynthesis protein
MAENYAITVENVAQGHEPAASVPAPGREEGASTTRPRLGAVTGVEGERASGSISAKAALICLVISLAVAAIAYGVGRLLPATYQSTGLIRVAVASQGGINDPVVTAANDTATQYAQLASSEPVATLAASRLGIPASSLSGSINGSTVSAQNLVQISATADSAAAAVARASAASVALQRYVTGLNARESAQYVARVQQSLTAVNQQIRALTGRLATDSSSQAQSDTAVLQSLESQQAQLLGDVARDAASSQPSLQVVQPAAPATVLSPKPKLYALVAFVVALIITGRAAFVLSRRRAK